MTMPTCCSDGSLPLGAGTTVFQDTIAEMTYPDVEAAIGRGAIGLWATGVIEQHGPHLPTGTDVYIPSARLRAVKSLLAADGIESLIIPPFYWGVNVVSASFPASIKVRPQVMVDLLTDVMASLAGDGMKHLFLISGHNDRAHNEAVVQAVRQGRTDPGLTPCFVCDEVVVQRLGIPLDDPHVLPFRSPPDGPPGPYLDVHAGGWETSIMLGYNADVVRERLLPELEPTNLGPDDLAEWRKGHQTARRITPLGYFGSPATATADRGRLVIEGEARAIVDALKIRLRPREGARA